ncbi:ROK family protein [Deinococcus hopiensis]|uniref:Glucokinase n=1 Tax=Deinococcus hopiensis KR-140 TaxID=695939 RepID=A0A1W1UKZ3_9DEIO|nr:ROK family protein [Deinococcus hopiensis]SMB81742.1 glucokinase [Deinococcus hopiensis KR-140]
MLPNSAQSPLASEHELSSTAIGVDIGGTKVAVGVLQGESIVCKKTFPTPRDGWCSVLDEVTAQVRHLQLEFPESVGLGVGMPGRLKEGNQEVLFANNIFDFEHVPVVEFLSQALTLPVVLENDAKAAALAENRIGAARGASSSVYITVSTGIGSGIILDGKIWRGFNGIAGELGHVMALPCGPLAGSAIPGALEAVASGSAIARDASFAFSSSVTTPEVFKLAKSGNSKAKKIVDNAIRFIGTAIADIQKFLDPEVFVIGGGVTEAGPYFLDLVQHYADEYTAGFANVSIRKAQLGIDAGMIGAALLAKECFYRNQDTKEGSGG